MQANWNIKRLGKEDEVLYDAFIKKNSIENPSVLGYHYNFYKKALEDSNVGEAFYTGLYDSDDIIAVLPGFIKTSNVGTVYNAMPFFGPNAGVLATIEHNTYEVHEALINYVCDQLNGFENILSAAFYTPFLSDNVEWYKQILQTDLVVDKYTQYLDIQSTELSAKIKYDLRKAEKAGLTLSTDINDEKVNTLFEIYTQNCIDYSIPPKPKSFIESLASASRKGEQVDFCFAHYENEIVGGMIVLYSATTLSYYLPCSLTSARTIQPVTVMIDHALQQAKQRGLKYWNWESSPTKESGVYKFKEKWGSIESEYKIFIKTFCSKEKFVEIGKEKIAEVFPYFFVYPFHLIN
ncbi:MAG: GNAT family N-acetyltransferase [Ferruginibacter sp.]